MADASFDRASTAGESSPRADLHELSISHDSGIPSSVKKSILKRKDTANSEFSLHSENEHKVVHKVTFNDKATEWKEIESCKKNNKEDLSLLLDRNSCCNLF